MNVHKDFLKVAVLLLSCYIFIFALQGKAGTCFALSGSEDRNAGSSAERPEASLLRLPDGSKQHVVSAGISRGSCYGSPVTSVRSLDDVTDEEVKDFIRLFHRSVVHMTNELDVSEEEIGRYLDLQDEKMRIMQNVLLDDVFRTKCQLFEHPELVDADLVEFQGSLYKKWHIERSENRITADVFEEHDLASWPQGISHVRVESNSSVPSMCSTPFARMALIVKGHSLDFAAFFPMSSGRTLENLLFCQVRPSA